MPRLIYTPEGAEPRTYDFAFGRIMIAERKAIEKACGMPWDDVKQGFFQNDGAVIHAVLWVLLKRDLPTLRLDQVEFCEDEIERDLNDDEARAMLAELEAQSCLDDAAARVVDELRERLDVDDDGVDGAAPKAEADESTTESTST